MSLLDWIVIFACLSYYDISKAPILIVDGFPVTTSQSSCDLEKLSVLMT